VRPRLVTQLPVPVEARAYSTLGRIDYEDAFRIDVGAGLNRTGEEWARAMVMDAPLLVRVKLVCGWAGLGLRLGPPWSRRRVLGWEIRRSSPESVLLGAGSWAGLPSGPEVTRERRHAAVVLRETWPGGMA
jgi:hypothetical protein